MKLWNYVLLLTAATLATQSFANNHKDIDEISEIWNQIDYRMTIETTENGKKCLDVYLRYGDAYLGKICLVDKDGIQTMSLDMDRLEWAYESGWQHQEDLSNYRNPFRMFTQSELEAKNLKMMTLFMKILDKKQDPGQARLYYFSMRAACKINKEHCKEMLVPYLAE